MSKFFTVEVKPDIVNGDVSNIIDADTSNKDVGAGDLIFDWTEVKVPKGGCMLRTIHAIVNAEDGAYNSTALTDYELIFAKSVNGEAPTSMGTVNALQTGGFDLKDHHVGSCTLFSTAGTGTITKSTTHIIYYGESDGFGNTKGIPMIFDLEGGNGGFNSLYVCGFHVTARNYNTGVIVNGAITSDTEDTITVDGVDAVKIFSVGDEVYVHDVDTALGTVKSVTTNSIVLNAPIAGGTNLADDDELVNANPIKITLGFEGE